MKVVIVGGVAGGATAAARIRRLDEQAEIVVFERSGYISYANCGLPYYIGDVITDRSDLTLQTPESFFSRFRVNMKVRHEVTAIHPEKKEVTVKNLETGEEFEESYDKLILSPGAKPTQPRLPGVGLNKLFTLRTVEDTFRIKAYISENHPKSAVLAGGGFISLELAENLRELGMEVTIVQRPKQLMNPFDPETSCPNYWLSALVIDRSAMCRQVRSDNDALYLPEQGKSCPTEILEAIAGINAEGRPIWKPMHMQPMYRMNGFITPSGEGRAKANAYIAGGVEDVGADIFERGLCLPSDNKMTKEQQEQIIKVIRRCFE